MAIGKCLRCDDITKLTEDHVVPKWFIKALPNFGLIGKEIPNLENELVCAKCNGTKGGKFDYAYPAVRDAMKPIISKWVKAIREHEEFNP